MILNKVYNQGLEKAERKDVDKFFVRVQMLDWSLSLGVLSESVHLSLTHFRTVNK